MALTSGMILMLWPGLGYWPILLALLPGAARLVAGNFHFKRTVFDLPLALFLGTAMVGVWAAYDRELAWLKFWILVAAILVYYALAGQSEKSLENVAWLLSSLGVFLSVYFLFTFDWQSQPEDFGAIDRLASIWMGVRPDLRLVAPQPNIIGGILAMLFPISLVPAILGWQSRQYKKFIFSLFAIVIILFGLFMTSSRGAWLALVSASGFWIAWKVSQLLVGGRQISRIRFFAGTVFLLLIGILLLLWIYPNETLAALDRLPGLPSGESRLELDCNALYLIADFPWTGAGLGSFGGLYSQYIEVIPYFFYAYSHNFYLDLVLEQGFIGALLVLGIFVGAGWLYLEKLENGTRKSSASLLAAAGFTGLLAVLLHGLIDDALYGVSGTPFLFLLPGMAVALSGRWEENVPAQSSGFAARLPIHLANKPAFWALSAGLLFLVLLLFFLASRSLRASWYANLGAVRMSRIELAGWPLDEWNTNPDVSQYDPAAQLLERSLFFEPEGVTANYRLGLISLQGRDFGMAQRYLEKALLRNPEHRGIRKVLGYVYVWNDQPKKAASLLAEIPEAGQEMRQYAIWWKKQGRQDLALKAQAMQESFLN